ncbi:MAG: PRTRC system ThiF family protein [Rhodocyclaceae bacterium]|nr:MAG: PRTRC system ThiF family protein [Rhodocyclaceae bacterium]
MIHVTNPALLQHQVNVSVVGAGGTGSQILTGLAQLHTAMLSLGHPGGLSVTVWDDDLVSVANVGRQMFFPSDVGMPKATVLVHRLNMTMGTNWKAEVQKIGGGSKRHIPSGNDDIVIGCVDNRKGRAAILAYCRSVGGAYWLDIGNREDDGQAVLGMVYPNHRKNDVDRLPHVADLFPEIIDVNADDTDNAPSCSLAEALEKQSLLINRGVSLWALNLLWQMFRYGQIEYHGVFVNLKTGRSNPLGIDWEVWKRFGYKLPRRRRHLRQVA